LFHCDVPICDIDFSPADVSEVKWATGESIKQQMAKDIFISVNKYLPYMDDGDVLLRKKARHPLFSKQ